MRSAPLSFLNVHLRGCVYLLSIGISVPLSIWASGVLLCTVSNPVFGATLAERVADIADYLRTPAAESPLSRWYSLKELGLPQELSSSDLGLDSVGDKGLAQNMIRFPSASCGWPLSQLGDSVSLTNSETWEFGIESGTDTVGYPSVVVDPFANTESERVVLFYAIHDPYSGIGMATSKSLDGVFVKAASYKKSMVDSRVLRAPRRPRTTSHFSSPVVIWNSDERKWFMYFHYYSNEWHRGGGHQRTGLAVANSISSMNWIRYVDSKGMLVSVLPVTPHRWMNSQSSYHSIHRLPSGLWLAFLRGVGGEYSSNGKWIQDTAKLGFAVSRDGRRWAEYGRNPVIGPAIGGGKASGVYRPQFIGLVAQKLLVCWSESSYYDHSPQSRCALTSNLRTFVPAKSPLESDVMADGPLSLVRQGKILAVFYGNRRRLYRFEQVQCRG